MRLYLSKTTPNPQTRRVPWYRYTVPCYAGLFLWIGYYQVLAQGTIDRAGFGLLFFGFLVGGFLSFGMFYFVPAILGMQTGYPLGVIGSSTFGSRGGQFVPGLLAGIVQTVWFGVSAYYAARLTQAGLGLEGGPTSLPFVAVVLVWCYGLAYLGERGTAFAARVAVFLAALPVVMMLVVAFQVKEGLPMHGLEMPDPFPAFGLSVHLVTAFTAIAVMAAPRLGSYHSSMRDTVVGGLLGITVPAVFAGMVGILTVAGIRALNPGLGGFGYLEALSAIGGKVSTVAPWVLLAGSIPAGLFLASMFTDSFTVMIPRLPRTAVTLIAATVAALLAISGLPEHLFVFLTVAAALCAPIVGIMVADYWEHDKRWPHTRPGLNYAGYGAWVLGIVCGLLPLMPVPEQFLPVVQPAAVYSCLAGFIGYVVLGNIGLKPYQKHRRKRVRLDSWEDETVPLAEDRARRHRH